MSYPNVKDIVDFDTVDLSKEDELWCKLDSILFSDITKIIGISEQSGNNDSRGGGCGYIGWKRNLRMV